MIIRDRKKQIAFEGDVLSALETYSRRTGTSLRTLINEAARDMLKKKGQPIGPAVGVASIQLIEYL